VTQQLPGTGISAGQKKIVPKILFKAVKGFLKATIELAPINVQVALVYSGSGGCNSLLT